MKKRSSIYLIIIIIFISLYAIGIYFLKDEIDNQNSKLFENLRNIFIVLGGFVAGILAIWRAIIADKNYENELKKIDSRNAELEDDRNKFKTQQLNERYAKSIELLGNSSISVRIGAMYTMWQLAQEDEFYRNTLNQILSSYIRNTLQSPETKSTREVWSKKNEEWKSANTKKLDAFEYEEVFRTKPYLRVPEDLKTALSILNQSDLLDIDLSNTDWSGFDFTQLPLNDFKNINFGNSKFCDTRYSANYKFQDCLLNNVNFDGAFIGVVEFTDNFDKESIEQKKGKTAITGTFSKSYLDHPVFSKLIIQTVFSKVYFRSGLLFSPKVDNNVLQVSYLIFKNCYFRRHVN